VTQSIIQTAVTNKTLRLELTYRVPCMLRQEDDTTMEPATHTGIEPPDSVQISDDDDSRTKSNRATCPPTQRLSVL
jgi:hypothetical protein